jgi:hypothetical protein
MTAWARDTARPVEDALDEIHPDVVLTSQFDVEVLETVSPSCPWPVVNRTFYVGPNPPRPLEDDFAPRAIPLIAHYGMLLDAADLVIRASDHVFDLGFDALPPRHAYVGPIGIREPPHLPLWRLVRPWPVFGPSSSGSCERPRKLPSASSWEDDLLPPETTTCPPEPPLLAKGLRVSQVAP